MNQLEIKGELRLEGRRNSSLVHAGPGPLSSPRSTCLPPHHPVATLPPQCLSAWAQI